MAEFRAASVSCYCALFEFRTRAVDSYVTSSEIDFTAMTKKSAVLGAHKFWLNRQLNLPEYFGELLAIKLFEKVIGPLTDNGALTGGNGTQFFEWKCDFPMTIEEYMEAFKK